MGRPPKNSLTETISNTLSKDFDLEAFKKSKYLDKSVKSKEQRWIPVSKAIQDGLSIPGLPMGHIILTRGHSDTGKTTLLLEAAINAQKMGILPVFIITEMKWNWDHAKQMGFEIQEEKDEQDKINYKGFFIYADRSSLETIEDVAGFIVDLLNEQEKGKLPYDLLFLWDSIGSIPCKMCVEHGKVNNEWNAGAYSQQFGNFVNQRITLSRKETQPYTNTLFVINKIWVEKPLTPMSQPKMKNKGGNSMFSDATLVLTFGNVTNSGTSKIKATKNGRDVEFAKRTKVSCDKNHITGITTKNNLVMTVHGFIEDDKKAIDEYKKQHSSEWLNLLGSTDFDVVEDNSEWDENEKDIPILQVDNENE